MRDLIEARVKLLNVIRAVRVQSESGFKGEWNTLVKQIINMEQYMKGLIDEFQKEYKEISEEQSEYEAKKKAYVEKAAKDPLTAGKPPENEPWDKISALGHIKDFLNLQKLDTTNTNRIGD